MDHTTEQATAPSLIQYPSEFPIKVMGPNAPDFATVIAEVAKSYDPTFNPQTIEARPSANGTYMGLTLNIMATSREQLDDLYQALTSHPMVKVVL